MEVEVRLCLKIYILSEKTGQYQKIEVGRLPSSFHSIKAIRKRLTAMTFAELGVRFPSRYHRIMIWPLKRSEMAEISSNFR